MDSSDLDYGGSGNESGDEWLSTYLNGRGSTLPGSAFKPKVYCHMFRQGDRIYIQYWFYYPYNDAWSNHEGDWEHICVVLEGTGANDDAIFRGAEYYGHMFDIPLVDNFHHYDETTTDMWIFTPYMIDGTHPVVFVGGTVDISSGSGPGTGACWPCFGDFLYSGAVFGEPLWSLVEHCNYLGGPIVRYNEVQVEVIPHFSTEATLSQAMVDWFEATAVQDNLTPAFSPSNSIS